jgi:hypothetical protein
LDRGTEEPVIRQEHLILAQLEVVLYALIELSSEKVGLVIGLKRVWVELAIFKLHVLNHKVKFEMSGHSHNLFLWSTLTLFVILNV